MSDDAYLAGLFCLVTGDPEDVHDMMSREVVSRGATSGPDPRIVSVPASMDVDSIEALGCEILGELPDNREERHRSFVRIRIPEGWSEVPGENSQIRWIVDGRGVRRIGTSDNGQWWDRYVSTNVVRQGNEAPLRLCYGEGTLGTIMWDVLTEDEREDVREGLRVYVQQGEDSPTVYADTAAKAQHWLDVIEAL